MAIESSRGLWECVQGVLHLFTTGLMVQLQLSSALPVVPDPSFWASVFGAHCPFKASPFNELSWPWIYLALVAASPRPLLLLPEKLQQTAWTLYTDSFLTLKFHQLLTSSPSALVVQMIRDTPSLKWLPLISRLDSKIFVCKWRIYYEYKHQCWFPVQRHQALYEPECAWRRALITQPSKCPCFWTENR